MRQNLIIRWTEEREVVLEQLRERLKKSSRQVEKIHGSPTNAAIVDEAFAALQRELDSGTIDSKEK